MIFDLVSMNHPRPRPVHRSVLCLFYSTLLQAAPPAIPSTQPIALKYRALFRVTFLGLPEAPWGAYPEPPEHLMLLPAKACKAKGRERERARGTTAVSGCCAKPVLRSDAPSLWPSQ